MAELAIARKHFPLHGLIVFIVHILIISNICSGYAFWTVAASTNAAFILGRPEITPKFVWTKGVQTTVLFMVICYICGMAFTYIL